MRYVGGFAFFDAHHIVADFFLPKRTRSDGCAFLMLIFSVIPHRFTIIEEFEHETALSVKWSIFEHFEL